MSVTLKIKRRAGGVGAGAPAALKTGELAFNEGDGTLYYGNGDDGAGNSTSRLAIAGDGIYATQAEQELASTGVKAVSPLRQQSHPSACKAWLLATVASGVPTIAASWNITSISDTGVGRLGVTIGIDFSSANWSAAVATMVAAKYGIPTWNGKAAGTISLQVVDNTETFTDPAQWDFQGFGDQ